MKLGWLRLTLFFTDCACTSTSIDCSFFPRGHNIWCFYLKNTWIASMPTASIQTDHLWQALFTSKKWICQLQASQRNEARSHYWLWNSWRYDILWSLRADISVNIDVVHADPVFKRERHTHTQTHTMGCSDNKHKTTYPKPKTKAKDICIPEAQIPLHYWDIVRVMIHYISV